MAELPRTLGPYRLTRKLGEGGMGQVFEAEHRELGRVVALKLLPTDRQEQTAESVERMMREARAASSLRHPGIVPLHEVGEADGQPFLAMALIEGRSLDQVMADGPVPLAQALDWMRQIARAVEHAHQRGVIHRDIKPGNILVDAEQRPYVTDFGLARLVDDAQPELTRSGQVLGSPLYMAPEQAAGLTAQADARSDVYSLGALFYFLLVGRPPFVAETSAQAMLAALRSPVPPPRRIDPAIPADVEAVCLEALEKAPDQRYQTAAALAEDVERVAAGLPPLSRPVGPIGRSRRWVRRNRRVSGLGAALLVALIALPVTWQLSRRRSGEAQRVQRLSEQARLKYATRDRRAVDALAARLLREHPEHAAGHFWRARRLLDRYQEGVRLPGTLSFDSLVEFEPRPAETSAQAHLRERVQTSLRQLGSLEGMEPWQAPCVEGALDLLAGRLSGAERSLRLALRLQPDDLQARLFLALTLYYQRRFEQAAALAGELLMSPADDVARPLCVRALLGVAMTQVSRSRDARSTIARAERAASVLPERERASMRSACRLAGADNLRALGELEQASKRYAEALAGAARQEGADPGRVVTQVRALLGQVACRSSLSGPPQRSELDQAVRLATEGLAAHPESARVQSVALAVFTARMRAEPIGSPGWRAFAARVEQTATRLLRRGPWIRARLRMMELRLVDAHRLPPGKRWERIQPWLDEAWRWAERHHPRTPMAWLAVAQYWVKAGMYCELSPAEKKAWQARSFAALERVVTTEPRCDRALVVWGDALLWLATRTADRAGRAALHRRAQARYARALEINPRSPAVRQRAVAWSWFAGTLSPDDPAYAGALREAKRTFREAVRLRAHSPKLWVNRGLLSVGRLRRERMSSEEAARETGQVRALLARLGRVDPELPARLKVGHALWLALTERESRAGRRPLEHLARAVAALDRLARVLADCVDPREHLELGDAYRACASQQFALGVDAGGALRKSVACYSRALRLAPGYARALNARGVSRREHAVVVERRGGDPTAQLAAAEADLRAARKLGLAFDLAYELALLCDLRARHARRQGRPDVWKAQTESMVAWLRRAVAAGGSTMARRRLGYALHDLKRWREAAGVLTRLVALEPGVWGDWHALSRALSRQGRKPAAIAALERAIALAPAGQQARLRAELAGLSQRR